MTSNGGSLIVAHDMVTTRPLTLAVKQKSWSWFKRTGRGFAVSKEDGSIVFVVDSKGLGKHRTIEDHQGKPLFNLERNWTSKSRAWVLTSKDKTVLTVEHSWLHREISMEAKVGGSSNATEGRLTAQASDSSDGNLRIAFGQTLLADMRCTNMPGGHLSSLMVSPPIWRLDVASGVDLCLIAVIAICVSDAFSENRFFMM